MATQRFDQYASRDELHKAYAIMLSLGGVEMEFAQISARNASTYQPHLYRGGYVIPGFGYSVERVGRYVSADRAGNPAVVERTR